MMGDIFSCESEDEYLKNGYNLNAVNKFGQNALFWSDLEKSKWLIKHGIDINHLDYEFSNAMMNIPSNYIEKAEYLITIGIDLSIYIKHPKKLELGTIRSRPVGRLIMRHLVNLEKEEINKSVAKIEVSLKPIFNKKRL